MQPMTTFSHPAISLWQSAIDKVVASPSAAPHAPVLRGPVRSAPSSTLMDQSVAAASVITGTQPIPKLMMSPGRQTRGIPFDCASNYVQLALATFEQNQLKIDEYRARIQQYGSCDPRWADVFRQYLIFLAERKHIPYRTYNQLDDYVLPLPAKDPSQTRVALLADWGTGTSTARELLADLAQRQPDVVIHLGDIYYSGTQSEVQDHFLNVFKEAFTPDIPVYTLAGNHDMYSGGAPYYQLLDDLKQPASYFCLRNDEWQILAMDTGLYDSDPNTVKSNLTQLHPDEVRWHKDKIRNAGGRRTVLLSHHQLFSGTGGVGTDSAGQPLAVNPHLYAAFSDVLDTVTCWIWGHEHNLIAFDTYLGLAHGRCIGSAAIPVLLTPDPYAPMKNLVLPPGATTVPSINSGVRLGHNGQIYNHAYAMLTLAGTSAELAYYQMELDRVTNHLRPSQLLSTERLGRS
ncbi:MAG: metallophosphoesterase [Chloroflexota bacterium]